MSFRIVVPNKGRLCERALSLLRRTGLRVVAPDSRLFESVDGGKVHVLFVRAQDIPGYVASGSVDLGITGLDIIAEREARVSRLMDLDFGHCRLAVAAPESAGFKKAEDIPADARVASSFPNLARKYFDKLGKKVSIVEVSGATEITPYIGVADCIVDLVQTGSTLREHNLAVVDVILDSWAVLIGGEKAGESSEISEFVDAVGSVMTAQRRRYLMANVTESSLNRVSEILPGLSSPTVMKLSKEGMYAIHAVVEEDHINQALAGLKREGASGILILPIERMVP